MFLVKLCAHEVIMQVNVCGLLDCLSGVWSSLSELVISLFLHPCFHLHGSHLQEEEMAESGVSGGDLAHPRTVLVLPIALSSYLLYFLLLGIFFLNPLAVAEFQMAN